MENDKLVVVKNSEIGEKLTSVKEVIENSKGSLIELKNNEETESKLKEVAEKFKDLKITTENLDEGKKAREEVRNFRYNIQSVLKHNNDLLNATKKTLKESSEKLIEIIEPTESRLHEQIQAIENKKKIEKEEKERIENERITGISKKIAEFTSFLEIKFQIGKTEKDLSEFDSKLEEIENSLDLLQEFRFEGEDILEDFKIKRNVILERVESEKNLIAEKEKLEKEKENARIQAEELQKEKEKFEKDKKELEEKIQKQKNLEDKLEADKIAEEKRIKEEAEAKEKAEKDKIKAEEEAKVKAEKEADELAKAKIEAEKLEEEKRLAEIKRQEIVKLSINELVQLEKQFHLMYSECDIFTNSNEIISKNVSMFKSNIEFELENLKRSLGL